MDPLLLGHARLRRPQSRRSLRASHGAFAGLLAAILVLAVVWAHSPEVPGPSPVGTLAPVPGLTYLPGTAIPALWECPRCGLPAGTDEASPPEPPRAEPYKTHLAYVKERRNDTDGAAILAEALDRLRRGA